MIRKNFRLQIILRISFITLLLLVFSYSWQLQNSLLIAFVTGALVFYNVFGLIRYTEKANRDLTRFLESIQYEDFSQNFSGKRMGKSFDELSKAFNKIVKDFQRISIEKEEQYLYLKTIVQHIGIGLIVFQKNGKVELINRAAKKIFGIGEIRNISKLKELSPDLVKTMQNLKVREHKLEKVFSSTAILQLSLYSTKLKLRNENVTLVSIQDIQSELEENELEAWQKLIRVLTHEILNSMTPIVSLSSTANDNLNIVKENKDLDKKVLDNLTDTQTAIQTIQKRSEGLLHFVEAFRRLYRLPQPNFKVFPIKEIIDRSLNLMQSEFDTKKIKFSFKIEPENLQITADPEMIEQVLINLLKNASQALSKTANPKVEIIVELNQRSRAMISVKDNGPGISDKIQEQVFIPFFTTKDEGSGIGLSLSRQILRLHQGSISVTSKEGEGTTFTLVF